MLTNEAVVHWDNGGSDYPISEKVLADAGLDYLYYPCHGCTGKACVCTDADNFCCSYLNEDITPYLADSEIPF